MATRNDLLQQVLSDIEKVELQKVADNLVAVEALKKVVLFGAYFNGTLQPNIPSEPFMNFTLMLAANKPDASNEELGADLRAASTAISLIQSGFNEVERFKTKKKDEAPEENPAL